jgi:hypothetical protein
MRLALTITIAAFCLPCVEVVAAEKMFAVFFAMQDAERRPEEAHTFVEFVRAEVNVGMPPIILQRDAISWLPSNLIVRLRALRPEPGRNLTLDETLELGSSKGLEILAWGPYEMTGGAYRHALARKAQLESGEMEYKAIDVIPGQSRTSTNCMHAAAEIDRQARRVGQYNVKYGEFATRQVIRHYVKQGYLCNPCSPHEDVWQALGLDGRCIDRRNDWPPNAVGKILQPRLRGY